LRVLRRSWSRCGSFWRPSLSGWWRAKFECAKCAISAICAVSPLLMCWIGGPLPIGTVLLRRCGDERDNLLPTRCVLADVPLCHPTTVSSGLGIASGGVSQVVKTASSRGRTGRTLFGHGDCCSPQARPRGAQECCGQALSVTSISHYGLLHRASGWQALRLSRWWAADARVGRMGR
jgi:hypothetical protein